MNRFLIITTLVFYSLMLATCNSASDKLSKNIRPTSQDCNEMAQGSGALLFEADNFLLSQLLVFSNFLITTSSPNFSLKI